MSEGAASRALLPKLTSLSRFTFVDVVLWGLRIGVVIVVVGGTDRDLDQGPLRRRPMVRLPGLRPHHRQRLRARRAWLHHGLWRPAPDQFRPWRHHDDGRLLGIFRRFAFCRDRTSRPQPGAGDARHPGGRRHHLDDHRPAHRTARLSALPACAGSRAPDLRDRRFVLPRADLPRRVRFGHPRLSRSEMAEDRRSRSSASAFLSSKCWWWSPRSFRCRSSISSCNAPAWERRCARFPKTPMRRP